MKANNFKIGDKVIIHCNDTRDEYKHKFYDNQVGKIIHIYDLDRNPWGNIVVILENMMQNGFFAEELEPIPSENNKEKKMTIINHIEAPEKLYILFGLPYTPDYTKFNKRHYDDEVEYTRTDAFIEKAEKYLNNKFIDDVSVLADGEVRINFSTAFKNFLKYLKEE